MSGTTWWWIGNAALAVVVAPIVVVLLTALLGQVLRLNRLADDVLENGVAVTGELDALPKLVQTKELTAGARGLVERYGGALLRLIGT